MSVGLRVEDRVGAALVESYVQLVETVVAGVADWGSHCFSVGGDGRDTLELNDVEGRSGEG